MADSFDEFDLPPDLREGIAALGWTAPTPIQSAALPPGLAGRDVVGQARTGSGKTGAFGLPVLQAIDLERRVVQALVLCPTRELATQVADAVRALGARQPNTRVLMACGGHPVHAQRKALRHGGHVVVGTPGRVAHLLRSGHLVLDQLRTLVLDEADRMLDMGFSEEVGGIVSHAPADRQTLLFSATFPEGVEALSRRTQRSPIQVSAGDAGDTGVIHEAAFRTGIHDRIGLVARLLAAHQPTRALVFCETRQDTQDMADGLRARGASVLALHGDLDQRSRDASLLQLLGESTRILVATDVAARGLDIPALPLVIVSELSQTPGPHVHRVGRTGRAGAEGHAFSIVARPSELRRLERIEAFTGRTIRRAQDPGGHGDLHSLRAPNRTLLLLAGRADKVRKGDVLGALVRDAGIPPEAVGRIDLLDRTTAVAIDRRHARDAERALRGGRVKGRKVRVRLL
ncbi:MAG: ATP-dependent RNA helicase DbpA [Myxococcota bacterium]|nr:ATP-dependent RNA helicase DbpA [Myxococcota bacterium]